MLECGWACSPWHIFEVETQYLRMLLRGLHLLLNVFEGVLGLLEGCGSPRASGIAATNMVHTTLGNSE
jgi:hypothetical protein